VRWGILVVGRTRMVGVAQCVDQSQMRVSGPF